MRALHLRIGEYVGRILKGATPKDLPMIFPRRSAFSISGPKAVGFTFPSPLIARADEGIE